MNLSKAFALAALTLVPIATLQAGGQGGQQVASGMTITGPTSCWAYYSYDYSFRFQGNLNGATHVFYEWVYSDAPTQPHFAMVPDGGTVYSSHYWTTLGTQQISVRIRGYVWNAALQMWEPTTPTSGWYSYGVYVSQPDGRYPRIDDAKKGGEFSEP